MTGALVTAAQLNQDIRDNGLASAVAVSTTAGDLTYATAANTLARLGLGTAGQVLKVNAGATAPEWSSIDDQYPWRVPIFPIGGNDGHVNWGNINYAGGAAGFGVAYSSGAQNAEITFNVVLAAGTYEMRIAHRRDADRGQYSLFINGVQHTGTFILEGYFASFAEEYATVSGVPIAVSGKTLLTFKMLTKHASSSGYVGQLLFIHLRRTA